MQCRRSADDALEAKLAAAAALLQLANDGGLSPGSSKESCL